VDAEVCKGGSEGDLALGGGEERNSFPLRGPGTLVGGGVLWVKSVDWSGGLRGWGGGEGGSFYWVYEDGCVKGEKMNFGNQGMTQGKRGARSQNENWGTRRGKEYTRKTTGPWGEKGG